MRTEIEELRAKIGQIVATENAKTSVGIKVNIWCLEQGAQLTQ
jgi:hypothetical protein